MFRNVYYNRLNFKIYKSMFDAFLKLKKLLSLVNDSFHLTSH